MLSQKYVFNKSRDLLSGQFVNFQWDDDEIPFVLVQHALLDFNSASSAKQQSMGTPGEVQDSKICATRG